MFRVTEADERSRTIVTIDGQLTGNHVEFVETRCDEAISMGKPIYLFLRNVTAVDDSGYTLLRRLAAKGVHLLAGGAYILCCSDAQVRRDVASFRQNVPDHAPI
jgi:anti-anti-sigma regulatory factor